MMIIINLQIKIENNNNINKTLIMNYLSISNKAH